MSDDTPNGDVSNDAANNPEDDASAVERPTPNDAANGGFKPITSQAQLDRILGHRLGDERAKYTAQLDATRAEIGTVQERAAAAEQRAEAAERDALRASVAAEKGVPLANLTGNSRDELEQAADALIAWRDAATPRRRPTAAGLKSGATGDADPSTGKERVAAAMRQLGRG